ncbi:MAG: EAL domain-containing protein [Wenzhouxiangella sp.]|nr:MAG: EAL domain-containing protein [Wenzhouxiangella sp.]
MIISSPIRPRRRAYLVLWLIALALAGLAVWLFQAQHRSAVNDLLSQHRTSVELSWRAVKFPQGNHVATYFDQHVMTPQTLEWLALAQEVGRRDEAREGLRRQLLPLVEQLRERGISPVHFHLPDGVTLLRFDRPEYFDDPVFEIRESVRRANQLLQPAHGFELGRFSFAYRNVFPIVDEQHGHLGSVEFSLDYATFLKDLRALWPQYEFELVVRQDLAREVLADGDYSFEQVWAGSPRFVTEPGAGRPDAQERVSSPVNVEWLLGGVSAEPALRARIEAAGVDVFRVPVGDPDYVVTQTPLIDPAGQTVGLLLSYAQEPALRRLDAGFWVNATLAVLAIVILALVSHRLLLIASQKFGERRRLNMITRSIGQGLYVADGEGVITEINPTACNLLGYDSHELVGQSAHQVFHVAEELPSEDPKKCPILAATSRGERFTGERQFRRKDGRILDVSVTSVPNENLAGSVTLFDDISRQKTSERQLKQIAHYDVLTGLPNRALLADRLSLAMARARRSGVPLALVFLDLDGFKEVNDTHGHDIGDRLLVRLARRMQHSLRETDTVARIGGDEFAVVLADSGDPDTFGRLLGRLLQALAQPEVVEGKELQVTASAGVSTYPQAEDIDADQLLRQADQAMYEAKLAGKNRYRVFDVDGHVQLRGRHQQIERLRQALEDDELRLYYQPRVHLRSGELLGFEALLRWQHPTAGLLHPAAFLPLVRWHELEIDIGRWVLRSVLGQMSRWRQRGLNLPVSINIAGEHLQRPEFISELDRALAEHPTPPKRLQLEIVESSALEDIEQICRVIESCAQLGVSVALDDFGTGYSSLTYLKRLPIRTLKLDQSFVRGMLDDPENLAIVDGILNLTRAFGLEAIAEGVETVEQGRALLQLGCERAQGYAIARPLPPSGVEPWLKQWQVYPEWAQTSKLGEPDREALYALVEHRAWMLGLEAYLNDVAPKPPQPHLSRPRLARHLGGDSHRRGRKPGPSRLSQLHAALHALAEELVAVRHKQDRHAALSRLSELEPFSRELKDLLEGLIRP